MCNHKPDAQDIASLQADLDDSIRKDAHERLQEDKIKSQANYRQLRQKFDELEETHHMMLAKQTRKSNGWWDINNIIVIIIIIIVIVIIVVVKY